MAITAATKLSDFSGFISAEMAAPIFDEAAHQSVVMQVARRVPLAGNGAVVPVTTSHPEADWVSEGSEKHKTSGAMSLVTMAPKKLAAIAVVSQEVVRANPGGYVEGLRGEFASAFAQAFDLAALHNLSGTGHSTGPFTTALTATTSTVTLNTGTTMYNDIVSGGLALAESGKKVTGIILDDYAKWLLLNEVDGVNRPLFDPAMSNIAGVPTVFGSHVGYSTTMGFMGDFSKCAWGVVGGINYSVSTEASVTINSSLVSLWEQNLVAIRAEAEYGFIVSDATASNFVKLLSSGVLGTLATP